MTPILCRCGRVRAIRHPDGTLEMRHKGRTVRWVASGTVEITCEDCDFIVQVTLDKERMLV